MASAAFSQKLSGSSVLARKTSSYVPIAHSFCGIEGRWWGCVRNGAGHNYRMPTLAAGRLVEALRPLCEDLEVPT
jgi:hypothetical protein